MLALVSALAFSFSSYCNAQSLGTGDCATDSTTNFVTGTGCANSTQSTTTIFDSTSGDFSDMTRSGATSFIKNWKGNDEIWFQHTQDAWAVNLAVTTALASAGIKVDGYSASWAVFNRHTNTINGNCLVAKTNGVCIDPLTITITAKNSSGAHIYEQTFDYGAMNTHNIDPSASDPHWFQQSVLSWVGSGQLTPGSGIASVDINIAGYDAGFWRGNYGPRVKNMVGRLILSVDICASTPLHSSSCPGYAQAYAIQEFNQQCSSNALYNSGCPGYATAYYSQQCSANALYDSGCSGYATAYYNQQCSANALYDSGCNGYAAAYYNQQCSANALYDTGCPGYATAYYNQQCSASALYDSGCPGYATAYFNFQCNANTLYDSQCPGYAAAYFNAQCSISALYDSQCPGYATAYFNQQCTISALYDTSCPGYETAYFNQQCTASALYNSQCPGYAAAYLSQQCSIDTLYSSKCNGYALAYYNQQCTLFPANDASCPNYYTAQCKISSLFDPGCAGYQTAFFDAQCNLNPQYDQNCVGYVNLSAGTVDDGTSVLEPVIEEVLESTTIVQTQILALNTPAVELPVVVPATVIVVAVAIDLPNTFDIPEETVASAALNLESSIEREIAAIEKTTEIEEVVVVEEVVVEEVVVEEVVVEETTEEVVEDVVEEVVEETTEETTEEVVEEKVEPKVIVKPKKLTKEQKAKAKAKKIKEIIQERGKSLADQMGVAVSLEVQKEVQNQLLAIIGFVPDFSKYGKESLNGGQLQQEVNLRGGRIVDHAFSRWFINDPGMDRLQELQYNLRRDN